MVPDRTPAEVLSKEHIGHDLEQSRIGVGLERLGEELCQLARVANGPNLV